MFQVLTQPDAVARIKEQESKLFPTTKWSGEVGELKVLETWKPEIKEKAA